MHQDKQIAGETLGQKRQLPAVLRLEPVTRAVPLPYYEDQISLAINFTMR